MEKDLMEMEVDVQELDKAKGDRKKVKTLSQIEKDIGKGKLVTLDGKALTMKQLEKAAKKAAKKDKRLELKTFPPVTGG